MRRGSPSRFARRNSPPRRGGRPRLVSPHSRSQPPPPGEERNRKINPWDAPGPHKRPRSRSRSRERLMHAREGERDRVRERSVRELPLICIAGEEKPRSRFVRGREPPRDVVLRKEEERLRERSRERHRERDRAFHAAGMGENNEAKHKHTHKSKDQDDGFEENYLDQQKNNFINNSGFPNNHEEPILDPASITFNAYPPETLRDNPRDSRRPAVHPSSNSSFGKHEKEENAEDRINRLEKLVEKLVESNIKPTKSKEKNYPQSNEVIPELIPSNSKFTTSMWMNRIHEECLHRNYDEKSSIRFMKDKMTGIMKAWFKSVSNYDFTWPELKLLITKTFPDNIEFAQSLKLLVGRDKISDETMTQYYFSKVYLCEACKITGENAVSCLVDGLSNPFMKQDIKSYKFMTPEALYSEYLSKFPENDMPVRVEHREVHVETREESEYRNEDFIPLEIEDRDRDYRMPPDPADPRGERLGNRLVERPMERPKCFTCNKFGHHTIDCRHAPICYICKKKGHIAAKCHFKNVMLITSVGSVSQRAPAVMCRINGKEFEGVIDTGAMTVTMRKGLAKHLKLKLKQTSEVLKGYGGSIVSALAEAYVTLTVDSTQRLTKVLVVDDEVQHDPLIVGQEFLYKGISVLIQNGNVRIIDTGLKGLEE